MRDARRRARAQCAARRDDEDVASLVLRNNSTDTCPVLADRRGLEDLGFHPRLMHIETPRASSRAVEYLPRYRTRRAKAALACPSARSSRCCAHYAHISRSTTSFCSRPWPASLSRPRASACYFPQCLSYNPSALEAASARREIFATQLTNSMINRGGATLVYGSPTSRRVTAASRPPSACGAGNYDMIALNTRSTARQPESSGIAISSSSIRVQDLLLDRLVPRPDGS